ncbi:MAG: hypothetical protein OMM_02349 [Candidatus Magnetoglobus multicellularis str. Araruama]|uniref:Cadherin domain-containing protein n=1 Tax=Candidatus Magnetoglobus multicellularis str. Araruama TaxID=890399 RepID=A0A1V1PAA8_9BACT|nr:MAG: hypothetical protein OMM_02349 [Candidatus Magnetoglobus multicellularis str. Araruama]
MFRASDNELTSNLAVVSIYITPVNDAPVGFSEVLTLDEDTSISYTLSAFDADGDWVGRRMNTMPEKGIVQMIDASLGEILYIPDPDAFGTDSFSYVVFDGTTFSEPAVISLVINEVNDKPLANTDTISIFEDNSLRYTLTGTDPDNNPLTFSLLNTPTLGSVTLADAATGLIYYTPTADVYGDEQIIFKVNDGILDSDPAVLTIRIKEFNDPPTASPYGITVTEDIPFVFMAAGIDPDNDPITYRISTLPTKGQLNVINAQSGEMQYTPNLNETGTDTFTYIINDTFEDSHPVTVTVMITEVNDPPVGKNYYTSLIEDTPTQMDLIADDVEGDSLTFTIVRNGNKGDAQFINNQIGRCVYVPSYNQTGIDSFSFQVSDGKNVSEPAFVTMTIIDVNDAPMAYSDTVYLFEDTPLSYTFSADDQFFSCCHRSGK